MTPLESYIEPARTRTGLWRILVGLIIIMACWLLGVVLVLLVWISFNAFGPEGLQGALARMDRLLGPEGRDPTTILIMLASFIGCWLGVLLAGVLLHRQSFGSFFAPRPRWRAHAFIRGILIGFGFAVFSLGIAVLVVGQPAPALSFERWLPLLAPMILLVFIQATAEELVFRGYLLQHLAALSGHWLVWAFLPSLLFGLLHLENLEGEGGYYYMVITLLMGLVFATLVYRTGSLWTAIGLHIAVNIFGLAGVTISGPLAGTQLYLYDAEHTIPLIQINLAVTVLLLAFVLSPFCNRLLAPAPQSARTPTS